MTVYFRAHVEGHGIFKDVARPFQFPGGELHLKDVFDLGSSGVTWIADVRGADLNDLGYAAMLADIAHARQQPFVLLLPYLPAARADRGEPLGSRVYAEFIRSFNPQQVIGIDPHSGVAGQYIHNLTELSPVPLVQMALKDSLHDNRYNGVIAPDKGAKARAHAVAEALGVDLYQADKKRDFETGEILGIDMTEHLPHSGKYLVVDDICDGGGTFVGLANNTCLHASQLGLWVTHGIFSGKADQLRKYYLHIYTTDSHPGHNRVGCATVVVPTETYMYQNLKEFG